MGRWVDIVAARKNRTVQFVSKCVLNILFLFLTINVDVCRRCQTGKFDSKGERLGKITVISFYVICVFIGECGFVLIGTLQRSI